MPKRDFKTKAELTEGLKGILMQVQNETIKDWYKYVAQTMVKHIKSDVYGVYTPKYYKRRKANGGLTSVLRDSEIQRMLVVTDNERINFKLDSQSDKVSRPSAINGYSFFGVTTNMLEYSTFISNYAGFDDNTDPPESYDNNSPTALGEMIEYGLSPTSNAPYKRPRPFMANTINELSQSEFEKIFKKKLGRKIKTIK